MLLLQIYRRLTAGELARRLEVSERTIQRDMEALSIAGVPVVAERGAGGGWALVEGYRTNLTGLNDAEIQSLFTAATPTRCWPTSPDCRSTPRSDGYRPALAAAPRFQ